MVVIAQLTEVTQVMEVTIAGVKYRNSINDNRRARNDRRKSRTNSSRSNRSNNRRNGRSRSRKRVNGFVNAVKEYLENVNFLTSCSSA